MPKDLKISLLCDYYGDLLTQKQKEAILLYYNEDLSLSEIAQELSITRQGARDNIQRGEEKLLSFEEILGIADKNAKLIAVTNDIKKALDCIKDKSESKFTEEIRQIEDNIKKIKDIL